MSLTAALALTAADERHIVDLFRTGHAVSNSMARTLRGLGLTDSKPLRQLVATLVIRRTGRDRYFLDEKVWAHRRRLHGATIVRVLVGAAMVVAAVALYLYGR